MLSKLNHILIGAVLSSVSFANPIDQMRPDAPELAAFGTFPIGVRTLEVTNIDQLDVLSIGENMKKPRYDRPLTLEVWYPAESKSTKRGSYKNVYLRDGVTKVTLTGKAQRDLPPIQIGSSFPLIILSHGYPGNRYLLSHLGENLASKGYVVVSIDHTESTYHDKAAFGSTLVNRPLDQMFVLNKVDTLSKEPGHFLEGLVDASNTGLIGYSMGGYGALISAGAGVTQKSIDYTWGAANGELSIHKAGSASHDSLVDPRLKAVVAFAPWGKNYDFWDEKGLAGIKTPIMYIAGSDDDVSGYENGVKSIFDESINTNRYLLTYHYANHNAGAPIPAPKESWGYSDALGFAPFEHYADPVWDSVRMNNIAQHFTTAFMGTYLKQDEDKKEYLNLVQRSGEGVYQLDKNKKPTDEHTYWKGFSDRSAKGLSFEFKAKTF
ncbi:alpha/beta hydrolase family protein [Marinomonas sp. 2405UD68-3]|uniref:alpha/beta hydrolase family protein n=1 Tax=Marinomonas sp. 2405UD68-3 TaxID=3391835 RepID=UPI0039C9F0FD